MTKPASLLVYYPAPSAPLTQAELEAEFAKLGRHDALWSALMQLLQERLASATIDAANADPAAAGRIQEILGLQGTLAGYRKGREARTQK